MSLKKTTLLILCAFGLSVTILVFFSSRYVLQDSFSELEARQMRVNIDRGVNAYHEMFSGLDSMAKDWANWDDTYRFVSDANPEYLKSNITLSALQDQRLNLIAYYDTEASLVFSAYLAPGADELRPMPASLLKMLAENKPLLQPRAHPEPRVDTLLPPEAPFLVASRTILTSEKKGPPNGVLLMGRYFDALALRDIRNQTRLDISLLRADDPSLHPDPSTPFPWPADYDQPSVKANAEDDVVGRKIILNAAGAPVLLLQVIEARDIYNEGRSVLKLMLGLTLLTALLCSLAAYYVLKNKVLARIQLLQTQIQHISEHGDHSQRVHSQGRDEITSLAKNINTMLDELESSKADLALRFQELQENDDYLKTLFNAIQAGVMLVDPQTHVISAVNDFAVKLTGRPRHEIEGSVCHGVICPSEQGKCPVTDLHQTIDLSTRRLLDAHGRIIPILKSVNTVERKGKTYLLETFIDISDIIVAEQNLKLSEERYRTIFTTAAAAMVIVRQDGAISLANPEFNKLGSENQEQHSEGARFLDFIAEQDAELVQSALQDALPAQFECRMNLPGDGLRHAFLSVAPLPGDEGHVVSIVDVTEQKNAAQALRAAHDILETQVQDRTRELLQANTMLKEMDKMKTAFLSSASHELRTPLTSVLGFAKLMRKSFQKNFAPLVQNNPDLGKKAAELDGNFEIITLEGERLTRLINDLLDLSKIEYGDLEWREESIDVANLLNKTLKAVAGQFAVKPELELKADIPDSLPRLNADPDRIQQVLFNLINNAVKFTDTGYVQVQARTTADHHVQISVQDTGMGVAPGEREKIFDKFYQSPTHDPLSNKPVGTGLGLAISRQIVERYKGRIWAESEPGSGATFTIKIPTE